MKRWVPLACIVLAGIGAIIFAEKQKINTRPSTDAVLTATADAEHELTRVPDDSIGCRTKTKYALGISWHRSTMRGGNRVQGKQLPRPRSSTTFRLLGTELPREHSGAAV